MIQKGQQQVNPTIWKVLTDGQRARYRACGRPLPRMLTAGGEVRDGAHAKCRYKWCPNCGRQYQQRVYACIEKNVGDLPQEQPRMVTLTMRLPSGLAGQLHRNIEHVAETQRRTHQRLRDHDHACRRESEVISEPSSSSRVDWSKRRLDTLPLPTATRTYAYARSYRAGTGFARPTLGRTTYIWAREITTGSNGKRWHVHLHYLVPSYSDAERLISAWDAEAEQRDATQCMISECISSEYAKASPARYMTKYVTSGDVLELRPELVHQYLRATKGRRQYDAAGEWRPLGVGGSETPPDQRVVALERTTYTIDHETGEIVARRNWYDAAAFFAGDDAWLEWASGQKRVLHLNQYRTMLSESETSGDCSDASARYARYARDSLELALQEAPWQSPPAN